MELTDYIRKIVKDYDEVSIATFGSHSALEVCRGAKELGFKTIVVCKKGREKTYTKYYRNIVDEAIVLEDFKDILSERVQKKLLERKSIFIPNRSFVVYVGWKEIEEKFKVPIFGNRYLLKFEERDLRPNQYDVLREAGIRIPKIFKNLEEIDRLVIIKLKEKDRKYERFFVLASNPTEAKEKLEKLKREGKIELSKDNTIEEFIVGTLFNFNFFYSVVRKELELVGIDFRRQTNIDGILRLPYNFQKEVLEKVDIKYIEIGHIVCTIRESMLEKAFEYGERFVNAVKKFSKYGMIGPFALQSAVIPGPPKEEIVVYDVSFRIPGSPGIVYSPYSYYKWGKPFGMGTRIVLEIKEAFERGILEKIVT